MYKKCFQNACKKYDFIVYNDLEVNICFCTTNLPASYNGKGHHSHMLFEILGCGRKHTTFEQLHAIVPLIDHGVIFKQSTCSSAQSSWISHSGWSWV